MVRIYDPKERIQGYTIEELITTGNNSVAYAARNSTGEKVFFKLYQSPSVRVQWYKPFVQHQKELKERVESGPCRQFCYRFLGGFEHDRKYHQVFEFLDRSHSLAQILDRIKASSSSVNWEQRELMAKVLVAGINQLHIARIVHADLKPDNIMLIEDSSIGMKYRLKIIDMDFSFFTDKRAPWDGYEGYFGTIGYMSPEHMARKVPNPSSDVFTLGIMLYQLLAQGHPYAFDEAEKYLPAYRSYSAPRPRLRGEPRPPAVAATSSRRCCTAVCTRIPRDVPPRPTCTRRSPATLPSRPPLPQSTRIPSYPLVDDAHDRDRGGTAPNTRSRDDAPGDRTAPGGSPPARGSRAQAARAPSRLVLASADGIEQSVGACGLSSAASCSPSSATRPSTPRISSSCSTASATSGSSKPARGRRTTPCSTARSWRAARGRPSHLATSSLSARRPGKRRCWN